LASTKLSGFVASLPHHLIRHLYVSVKCCCDARTSCFCIFLAGHVVPLHRRVQRAAGVTGISLTSPGLPDGLFSYQKSQFGYIFEDHGLENFGVFYGHLAFLLPFWFVVPRKIWQLW
jgi:hypothetical protein